jgi:hypothetical protein
MGNQTEAVASTYIKILLWPVLAAGLFHIAGSEQEHNTLLHVVTNAALISAVLWKCSHEHASWKTATIVGGICGAAATLLLALYQLITDFHVVRLFNLITQPVFTGVVMAIATGFVYNVLQLINAHRIQSRNIHNGKGGDHS